MDNNRLMNQISAIFSVFMVLFYIGVGIYLIFYFKQTFLDRALLVIMGSAMIFYGIFRAFKTYSMIINLFFRGDYQNEDDKYI